MNKECEKKFDEYYKLLKNNNKEIIWYSAVFETYVKCDKRTNCISFFTIDKTVPFMHIAELEVVIKKYKELKNKVRRVKSTLHFL